jgi:hypothetical protein
MSEQPSRQSPAASRKFVPGVNSLESRLLLSQQVSFPNGASFIFPSFLRLPRTGGAMLQSGTALTVGVGQPTTNTAHIGFDGIGGATVEWNGRSPHSVTGVRSVLVQAGRAGSDQVTFHLTTATPFVSAAHGPAPATAASAASHPVQTLRLGAPRTGGTAVQSGSILTCTITSPRINNVVINTVPSSSGTSPDVQVEWNGGSVHNFMGVDTIIVDIKNGRRDLVALDNAAAKGP